LPSRWLLAAFVLIVWFSNRAQGLVKGASFDLGYPQVVERSGRFWPPKLLGWSSLLRGRRSAPEAVLLTCHSARDPLTVFAVAWVAGRAELKVLRDRLSTGVGHGRKDPCAESPPLWWRLHRLAKFIGKQVLNIVRENDANQLPEPLQRSEREMEPLPER